jgi:tRNA U38,U39,U40 pseudouridine synthase TruA
MHPAVGYLLVDLLVENAIFHHVNLTACSAISKEYHFRVSTAAVPDPFHCKYFQHVSMTLDMKLLRCARVILHATVGHVETVFPALQ